MPRPTNFAWVFGNDLDGQPFFKMSSDGKLYVCNLKNAKGGDCGFSCSRHPSNMNVHLTRSHGLSAPKETTPKLNFSAMPTLETHEMWAINFAKCALSFNVADMLSFKATLAPTLPCRHTIARATETVALKLKNAALKQVSNVTLCYDSGTVGRTYLFVSAATPVGNFLIRAVSLESNTTDSIEEVLKTCKIDVEKHGGCVIAVCADNASNMQAVEVGGVGKSRCAAHVLNLCVKEICDSVLQTEIEEVNALALINKEVRAACPTRWCYQYERFKSAAAAVKDNIDSRYKFEKAAEKLEPLRIAIDSVQRDDATLFSCLVIWEKLFAACDDSIKDIIAKRFKYMLREPYLLISYFSPTANVIKHGQILEDKVKEALEAYDADAAKELSIWTETSHALRRAPLCLEEYLDYVSSRIRSRCPRIARLIAALAKSTPTEACVERAFSKLRQVATDYRNRLSEERVEQQMIIATTFEFLERCQTRVSPSAPRTTPSPSPQKPCVEVSDDEAEEEEEEPDLENTCGQIFQLVVDAYVEQNERARPAVTNQVRTTRRTKDLCAICNTPCATHRIPAYVACECGKRVSVEHDTIMVPLYKLENPNDVNTHVQLKFAWRCEEHA